MNKWFYDDTPEYKDTITKIDKILKIRESHFADGVLNYMKNHNRVSVLQRRKIVEILRKLSASTEDFIDFVGEDEGGLGEFH